MNERIKRIRLDAEKTQSEFGEILNYSQNYIAQIETGKKIPSDRLLSNICRIFNVNHDWLVSGNGMPYKDIENEEMDYIINDLIAETNPFYDIIIEIMKTYKKLDDNSQKVIINFSKELLDNIKKKGD